MGDKDPCQKYACNLQACLKRNGWQESKCEQPEMRDLLNCCRSYRDRSPLCVGMRSKWDLDLIKEPSQTMRNADQYADPDAKVAGAPGTSVSTRDPAATAVVFAAQDVGGLRCWNKVDRMVMSFT